MHSTVASPQLRCKVAERVLFGLGGCLSSKDALDNDHSRFNMAHTKRHTSHPFLAFCYNNDVWSSSNQKVSAINRCECGS